MKRLLLIMLAAPCLAATPLDAVNRALLAGDAPAAWQALAASWPQLASQAQRDSWQAALAALAAEHCGKDAPVQLPPWQAGADAGAGAARHAAGAQLPRYRQRRR